LDLSQKHLDGSKFWFGPIKGQPVSRDFEIAFIVSYRWKLKGKKLVKLWLYKNLKKNWMQLQIDFDPIVLPHLYTISNTTYYRSGPILYWMFIMFISRLRYNYYTSIISIYQVCCLYSYFSRFFSIAQWGNFSYYVQFFWLT